jgi:prevent-host-death family protein
MSEEEHEIPQRELRNDIGRVLRRVAAGERLRITVRGRPVADLVPVSEARRFVPRSEFAPILLQDPLDHRFQEDVRAVLGGTVDEL